MRAGECACCRDREINAATAALEQESAYLAHLATTPKDDPSYTRIAEVAQACAQRAQHHQMMALLKAPSLGTA